MDTKWEVELVPEFAAEVETLSDAVQEKLAAGMRALSEAGPRLGRPFVDTLKGSKHANMKELRFSVGKGAWRVAFAFDFERKAILLVGSNKSGKSQKRFYGDLIRVADERFDDYLLKLRKEREN